MQEIYEESKAKPIFTLLFITAIVYFFLEYIWTYFAPVLLAFLVLYAVNPAFDFMSEKFHIGKKLLVYLAFLLTFSLLYISVGLGLIPYLKCFDFAFLYEFLEHPYMVKCISYLQEKGSGTLAQYSAKAIQISSSTMFYVGAFILSLFLLAADFEKITRALRDCKEGEFMLSISDEVITYAKAYLKTQAKLFVIIAVLSVPTLLLLGIKEGWLLGILAGVMDLLPVFGTGIVLIPVAIWQFLEKDYSSCVVVVLLYLVCAVVREILEPKFLGSAIKLPAIGVWASIYAGMKLFGAAGFIKGPIGFLLIYTIYKKWKR
ncbi:MAG: AI-2E family transporter [Lachnospiraceae bacterium]